MVEEYNCAKMYVCSRFGHKTRGRKKKKKKKKKKKRKEKKKKKKKKKKRKKKGRDEMQFYRRKEGNARNKYMLLQRVLPTHIYFFFRSTRPTSRPNFFKAGFFIIVH